MRIFRDVKNSSFGNDVYPGNAGCNVEVLVERAERNGFCICGKLEALLPYVIKSRESRSTIRLPPVYLALICEMRKMDRVSS